MGTGPGIDEVVTGKNTFTCLGGERVGTQSYVKLEPLAVVLLGSLVFGGVTRSLGERFATFQSYLCLTLED